jgi:hypothetical protein
VKHLCAAVTLLLTGNCADERATVGAQQPAVLQRVRHMNLHFGIAIDHTPHHEPGTRQARLGVEANGNPALGCGSHAAVQQALLDGPLERHARRRRRAGRLPSLAQRHCQRKRRRQRVAAQPHRAADGLLISTASSSSSQRPS